MTDNPFASPEVDDSTKLPSRRWGSAILIVFLLAAVGCVLVALFLPLMHRGRIGQCWTNLRTINVALGNYHDEYGSFPPAYTVDANGRPLHSWRTLLLPYLNQKELYQQIDLSKPWNDPANAAALETSLSVFRCPSARMPSNHTTYLCVSGRDFCFHASDPKSISDITDGTSNTLMVVEVPQDKTVPWMSPQDASESLILGISEDSGIPHTGRIHTALADGSVRFISTNLDRASLRALLTISGNEVVGEF